MSTTNCPFARYGEFEYFCLIYNKWCHNIPAYACKIKENDFVFLKNE